MIDLGEAKDAVSDDLVFESLWYRRGAFITDSLERTERLLNRFVELLRERRNTRAKVRQTVHLVWDRSSPIPDPLKEKLTRYADSAGISLFLNSSPKTHRESTTSSSAHTADDLSAASAG